MYSTQQFADAKKSSECSQKPDSGVWPVCAEDEQEAALRVLRSGKLNYWTGEEGKWFEREYADYVGTKHAVAVANGTVGLELALFALGVGAGDEVIVPSRTFIATASAVVARAARPVCADVDIESQNVTAETIKVQITPRTKAIIVVHLGGWPCEMDSILELAKKHDIKVIEDCAQAHGAKYRGNQVGSMGDVGVFSFCQDKILTTAGEGGMLVTNSDDLWRKAWSYKDHGKSYHRVHYKQHPPGFRWLHESFGTNLRMTEVQSAIGRVALRKLPDWLEKRRRNASMLIRCFRDQPTLRTPVPESDFYHAYYKCYTFIKPETLRVEWDRQRILREISTRGVPCFSGSCSEIYLERAFPAEWRPSPPHLVAKELGEKSLMFLVHPTLSTHDIAIACNHIESVLIRASKCMPEVTSSQVAG